MPDIPDLFVLFEREWAPFHRKESYLSNFDGIFNGIMNMMVFSLINVSRH